MSWDMYDMTQKVQVVVVAIVLPLVILAASLWHDWVEEGQSPRARKIMKDWEWNIDEMAHAVNVKGRLIGYRVLQAGVIIYLGYSRLFRDYRSIELSVLAIVSIVAEVLFIIIKTIRNMAGDEDKTQMWKQMGHSVFNNLMYLCIVVECFLDVRRCTYVYNRNRYRRGRNDCFCGILAGFYALGGLGTGRENRSCTRFRES